MKYSELKVWQKAIDVVVDVYAMGKALPQEERFALVSQMQRAAVSIPANIAEGHGRKATNAFVNHLSIANGSLVELETLITISRRLGYVDERREKTILSATAEIGRMMSGLKDSLGQKRRITA
jgi:four helix bundle protein